MKVQENLEMIGIISNRKYEFKFPTGWISWFGNRLIGVAINLSMVQLLSEDLSIAFRAPFGMWRKVSDDSSAGSKKRKREISLIEKKQVTK
jgi:hypothetical protein